MVTAGDAGTRDSPPSSPRLRQTTFGATLDFIEALCDASSRLTSFPPVSTFHYIHRAIPAAWSVPSPLQEGCPGYPKEPPHLHMHAGCSNCSRLL